MDRWVGQVAIVTGASSGIGKSVAEVLVNHKLKVVGLARNVKVLEEMSAKFKDKYFYGIHTDITNEEDILKAFKWVEKNLGPISILINSAGVVKPTGLIDGNTSDFKSVLDTNILGLTIATREAVKSMRYNKVDGHIIHINSVAGHYVPYNVPMNIYPASKFAVTALTESLRQELIEIKSKIKVSSISPGMVHSHDDDTSFSKDDETLQMLKESLQLNPKDISDAVVYTLSTPRHVQITELTIRPVAENY